MKAGAANVLTKPIADDRLIAAIEEAIRRDAKQRQEHALCSLIHRRLETLTTREKRVMMHVIRGRLNKHIAVELVSCPADS
jgi:two-component system, LuxR family, response regulator FixJ